MDFIKIKNQVINEISTALNSIDPSYAEYLAMTIKNADRVFVVGVGRVLLSLQAFVKRLNHLGINAYYVGQLDEPHFQRGDVLIVGSGSGNTLFPVAIAKKASELGGQIIHIGSNENSDVTQYTDYMVRIPTRTKLYLEDEIDSKQPMTSLFEQTLYILCDIICEMIIDQDEINIKDLWEHHANLE